MIHVVFVLFECFLVGIDAFVCFPQFLLPLELVEWFIVIEGGWKVVVVFFDLGVGVFSWFQWYISLMLPSS